VVAIPAVAAFNAFQRRIKSILGNAEALRHIVLSYVKALPARADRPGSGSGAGAEDSQIVQFEALRAAH
jgi:hypothetical protein